MQLDDELLDELLDELDELELLDELEELEGLGLLELLMDAALKGRVRRAGGGTIPLPNPGFAELFP